VSNFPIENEIPTKPFEIDPNIVKAIYEHHFYGKPNCFRMVHLNRFHEKFKALKIRNTNNNILKVKLFPYSLAGKALDWVLKWPPGKFSSWFNFKVAFIESFGSLEIVSHLREIITSFKKTENELLLTTWDRFMGLAYGTVG
jgi:hypothetical protein